MATELQFWKNLTKGDQGGQGDGDTWLNQGDQIGQGDWVDKYDEVMRVNIFLEIQNVQCSFLFLRTIDGNIIKYILPKYVSFPSKWTPRTPK